MGKQSPDCEAVTLTHQGVRPYMRISSSRILYSLTLSRGQGDTPAGFGCLQTETHPGASL